MAAMTPIATTISGTAVTLSTTLAAVNALLQGHRTIIDTGGLRRRLKDVVQFGGPGNANPRHRLDPIPAGTIAAADGPPAPAAAELASWLESPGPTFAGFSADLVVDVLALGLRDAGMVSDQAEQLAGKLCTGQRGREADLAVAALVRAAAAAG